MNYVLLSLIESQKPSTGHEIFCILDKELTGRNISWKNCMSFATDNASVMTRKHKGVTSFIIKENPNVYVVGCACHLMNIAT